MKTVKILKACYVDNKPRKVGDIVETTSAAILIGAKQAEITDEKPKAKVKTNRALKRKDLSTRDG